MEISLCMIVKDEEPTLERCLSSIKDAVDEIIIVDTGSKDKTKEIAKKFTDKVYDFKWINNFSAARNFAFSKATKDYQMWLDADDVVPNPEKIIELKEKLKVESPDIVMMKYITHFEPLHSVMRERLLKREKNYKWEDAVHEFIPLYGIILNSEIEIHHKKEKISETSTRNIEIYESQDKENFTPRQIYYYARELKDHQRWEESAKWFEKFLEKDAWQEDKIQSCLNLSTCYEKLGKDEKILKILIKSFEYDSPRAEVCVSIGYYYKKAKDYKKALKWFELATNLNKDGVPGFILEDYWGYIPNIESCLMAYELGDIKKAIAFNEKAREHKITEATESNRGFFLRQKLKL